MGKNRSKYLVFFVVFVLLFIHSCKIIAVAQDSKTPKINKIKNKPIPKKYSIFSKVKVAKNYNWIKSIRIWPSPESTRIVFDLSQLVKYKIITLKNPYRVVVDFENVNFNVKINDLKLVNTKIKKIRHGVQPNNNVRVVFETEEEFTPNSFTLKPNEIYGHRLVLDLESSEKQAILALFDLDIIDSEDKNILDDNKKNSQAIKNTPSESNFFSKDNSIPISTPSLAPKPKDNIKLASKDNKVIEVENLMQKKSSVLSLQKFNEPKPKDFIIAIDCGHGGEDPGAVGKLGTKEKHVVLAIGRELKELVNKQPNMRAFLTRNGDYYVGLRERVIRARKRKADLFISIHADAFRDRNAKGASVFIVSNRGASSEAARWIARKENRSDFVGGINLVNKNDKLLASVLLDMSQTSNKDSSLKAAKYLLNSLGNVANLHTRQVENAGFAVLKAPDIPSVLVETGFISNPYTESKLRSKRYQKKIANAIMLGVKNFFKGKVKVSDYNYAKKRS